MTPLTVIYADDDADIRTIVGMALSLDPAIAPVAASSGAEVLATVTGGALPDVALLDVIMPGMTGVALLERLARDPRTATLPVIFMTAKARDADLAAYRAKGAIGIIVKPFDPLRLAAQVRAMLDAYRRFEG